MSLTLVKPQVNTCPEKNMFIVQSNSLECLLNRAGVNFCFVFSHCRSCAENISNIF